MKIKFPPNVMALGLVSLLMAMSSQMTLAGEAGTVLVARLFDRSRATFATGAALAAAAVVMVLARPSPRTA